MKELIYITERYASDHWLRFRYMKELIYITKRYAIDQWLRFCYVYVMFIYNETF